MSGASMSEPLSALIIGCGDIAGGYDERGDRAAVLSHAGAYGRDPRFEVRACVEPDAARRAAFMAHWNIAKGYGDLESCLAAERGFDVVSLCAPTAYHGAALERLRDAEVRLVFAEKPLTGEAERSARLVEAYDAVGKPLCVNYFRRWDQHLERLHQELAAGEWGEVQAIGGLYAKGLNNCASHFFDLLDFLLGDAQGRLVPVAVIGRVDDGRAEDPTLSVLARLGSGTSGAPVTLIGVNGERFFPFEIDLVMERGRITLEDLGGRLRQRRVRPHPLYGHQPSLDDGEWQATGMPSALLRVLDNIHDHLTAGAPLASTGESALRTERLCGAIMAMAETQGDPA